MAEVPVDVMGRELPYSREAELAVIGSALTDTQSVTASAEIVRADDFYFPQNREIYNVIIELFNENSPIDFITISNRLNQYDKLEAVGGMTYLRNAATDVPTTRHTAYYANIIKEKSTLRKLISSANAISDMAYEGADKVDRVLEQSEQLIFDVSSSREKSDILPVGDILIGSYQTLVENSQNRGGLTGIATGFSELNKRTGGFHGGELILIAGRPGMGKSSFAVNIAEHVSINDKRTVAVFNLEMPKEQIVNRIICSQAMVNTRKLRNGEITSEDWEKIGAVVNRVATAPMYIDDTASVTVSQIRAKCRRLKQTKNLALIVIDYLQLMQSSGRTESRQQEISEISRSLKILAKELDVPVIALSQLSRASESRSDKRPMLSDLRESGAIEQDADMVMFLYRDDYYNKDSAEKNIAECIVAKHRNGETGMFKLGWKGEYTKFSNLEFALKEE
ncbi:MAG: replicative DNA helicase [Oscillospiraceae bacterium]|nr:replicative DNA helicase [Oscillospiraceae bacterium]